MTDCNVVMMVGRLTKDAALFYTGSGTPNIRFSIAVNRAKKTDNGWMDEVSYFDVVHYGKSAEKLSKMLTKGKQVIIEGDLRQTRWEKDGQPHSKVEIYAEQIQVPSGGEPRGF